MRPAPLRPLRRPALLGLIGLVGVAGCAPIPGPRLIPLQSSSPPERPPLALRRSEREVVLAAAHTGLLQTAREQGRLLSAGPLGARLLRLAEPLQRAAQSVRRARAPSSWPIDVIRTEITGVADILPMVPSGLVVVLPLLPGQADHSDLTGLDDNLLSALLAHGLAHGLRDHALETEWIAAGMPRFTPIQEREADRDTCEILARAGMDPLLAWHLRARMAQGLPQPASAHDWAQRHPDPPQARQSIEAFVARVRPLQSNPPVVR